MELNIIDNTLINKNEVEDFINHSEDIYLIRDILFKLHNLDLEDVSYLKENILKKLKTNPPSSYVKISLHEYNRLANILYTEGKLTKRERKDLYICTEDLLDKLTNYTITNEETNYLELYLFYLYDLNAIISPKEKVFKVIYDDYKTKEEILRKEKELETEKQLVLENKNQNSKGLVASVVIIESAIVLGILLSLIALAK